MLERNWREGRCVPSLHFKAARPHRIQIDEVEGTVLSTHVTGMPNDVLSCGGLTTFAGNVTSTCIQSGSPLWTEVRLNNPKSRFPGVLTSFALVPDSRTPMGTL